MTARVVVAPVFAALASSPADLDSALRLAVAGLIGLAIGVERTNWWLRVEKGIESATAFVVVLSPEQLVSVVCARELAAAAGGGKRIVPVLRREVEKAEVPEVLADPNWILAREADDFEAAVARLIEALDLDLEWLDRHARLLVRAREWERERRDSSFLLRGRDLQDAEGWLAQQGSHREGATTLQADFVVASRSAARRRGRIVFGESCLRSPWRSSSGLSPVERGAAIEQSKISRSTRAGGCQVVCRRIVRSRSEHVARSRSRGRGAHS